MVPVTRRFRPDMILISCGFDSHRGGRPWASMQVSGEGFATMTRVMKALADEIVRRPIASLEGGYALSAFERHDGVEAMLDDRPHALHAPSNCSQAVPSGTACGWRFTEATSSPRRGTST